MNSGSIAVEWDAAGRLKIQTTENTNLGDGKKRVIEKLLDAARAVNDQGTRLIMPPATSAKVISANR